MDQRFACYSVPSFQAKSHLQFFSAASIWAAVSVKRSMCPSSMATSLLAQLFQQPLIALQGTCHDRVMCALASTIILLTATCFGQGVGPPTVGMLNDALK